MATALMLFAVNVVTARYALAGGADVTDEEALAISWKRCVMCHAVKPTHESFQQVPKDVALETIANLKKHAQTIYAQTVQNTAMPLGNQNDMTADERAALGCWVEALK